MKTLTNLLFTTAVVMFVTTACAGQDEPYKVGKMSISLEEVVSGVKVPWGIVWLSDGSMLYTERSGELIHVVNGTKTEVQGVPEVYARGQGGLLDIELSPDYSSTGWIYLSYSEEENGEGGNTTLIRARLEDDTLIDIERLFKAIPNSTRRQHFGGRIAFDGNGHVFLSLGERGDADNAQTTANTSGCIVRLNMDGSIPEDNPFVNDAASRPEIWSYGHRNPQGLEFNPTTGDLMSTEHGPMGGDELNLVRPGANYGWPVITYGKNYDGSIITEETKMDGMEQPQTYWVPSIAPSSLMFVTSDKYPEWQGDALVGSLKFNYLVHVKLQGNKVNDRKVELEKAGRIREIKEGPDGFIYLLIEQKGIFRLIPN
jgi:glucose/arabinose dehydrogenase